MIAAFVGECHARWQMNDRFGSYHDDDDDDDVNGVIVIIVISLHYYYSQ